MPKFGGLGRKKKPCILRKCSGMSFASDEGKMLCFAVHTAIIIIIITPAIFMLTYP